MPDIRLVNETNQGAPIAAQVRQLARANAIPVVQVNVSGDIINPGGGSSGGNGAILDGINSAILATVKQFINSNPLVVILANPSGDVSNDVSTVPKTGETWPVSIAAAVTVAGAKADGGSTPGSNNLGIFPSVSRVNKQAWIEGKQVSLRTNPKGDLVVTLEGEPLGSIGVSGDVSTFQKGAWATAVTGDVSTKPLAGQTWPVSIAGTVNVSGTSSANPVGVSGDVSTFQRGAWATSITGDVLLRQNATATPIGTLSTVIGVQIVGGQSGGSTGVSGDVSVKIGTIPGDTYFPVSGDQAIVDGVTRSIKATVKNYTNSKPLAVTIVNNSGDGYNANQGLRVVSGTFSVVNVTTAATQILAANPARVSAVLQNVDIQQITVGLTSSVTIGNGLFLAPISGSSGDGGVFTVSSYTGAIWGITATGDADVRYMEI